MTQDLTSLLSSSSLSHLQRLLGPGAPTLSLVKDTASCEEDWIIRLQKTRQGMRVSARPKRGGAWRDKASQIPNEIKKMSASHEAKGGYLVTRLSLEEWHQVSGSALVRKVKQVWMVFVRIVRRVLVDRFLIQASRCAEDGRVTHARIDPQARLREKKAFLDWCGAGGHPQVS